MKYSMFIGRWQPWHKGHRWLIDQRLNKGKNVLVCIREVGLDDSNPYNPHDVKKNIENELNDLIKAKRVKVIIIPDIESVNYGSGHVCRRTTRDGERMDESRRKRNC